MVMRSLNVDFKTAVKQICQDYHINNAVPDREAKKRLAVARNNKNVAEMFEQDFNRVFTTLAYINRYLIDLTHDIRTCMRYPDIFMYQLKIDNLLENMSSTSQADRIEAWRRAKKVFPWLKT